MPDSGAPKWARYILRTLRVFAGVFAIMVGVGDLYNPSGVVTRAAGLTFVNQWAWLCVVAGAVAVVASLTLRWRWELVSSAMLVVALSARATAVWLTVDDGLRVAAAAGTSLAGMLFLIRSVELMVFGLRASAAPWARRKVARDGGV